MAPAALAANRDELFFRAGEASARIERGEPLRAHRIGWPAAAAALALLAAGLGTALLTREPEVRVVHVERPAHADGQASSAARAATPRNGDDRDNVAMEPAAWVYAANEIHNRPNGDGIIHQRDWAALSDAFAAQLRLQQERSHRAQEAMSAAKAENRSEDVPASDAPRGRAQTYLELRDAMQTL
jgi:hypothetical protein